MAAKLRAHPLLDLLPRTSPEEQALRLERVKLYGQRDVIEVVDGQVVAGWDEHVALTTEGIAPKVVKLQKVPDDLTEYVLRRNIPRELSGLDRGCIAVLAYQEMSKGLGRARKAEGGRSKGKIGHKDPDAWTGKQTLGFHVQLTPVTASS